MLRSVSTVRPTNAPTRPQAVAPAAPASSAVRPAAASTAEAVQGEFTIKKRFWSFLRPTYDIMAGGEKVGTIQRKLFSWTPTWNLKDADGATMGTVNQKFFALGFDTTVKDAEGRKVGAIKQDIIRSLVNPTAALRVVDGQGQVIAKTDPVWLTFSGRIDLKSPEGDVIGQFSNKWFSLSDANKLKLTQPMDKRLVLGFVASQIEVKKQEEAARREEEREREERDQADSTAKV